MARFDHLAKRWDKRPYPHAELMARMLQPEAGQTVLDVGGGTGLVAQTFAPKVRRVIVIDPSAGMIEQAARKAGNLRAVRGDGQRMPIRDDAADAAIMVDALHHVKDQDAALRGIVGALRPGGRLVLQEFRMDTWWRRLLLTGIERLFWFGSRFDHAHGWTKRLESVGLRVDAVETISWSDVMIVARKPG